MILLGKPVAEALRKEYEANAPKSKGGRVLTVICNETTDRGYLVSIHREADLWGVKVETVNTPLEAAKTGAKKVIDLRENPPFLYGFPVAVDGQAYSDCTQVYHETGVTNTTPCTVEAILRILAFYGIPLEGRNAVIIGRSNRVGKPLALMMLARDATVTVCHSKTPKEKMLKTVGDADIVVCATGVKGLINRGNLKTDATVVNVGGDYDEETGHEDLNLIPYIGGVGCVTSAVLMRHVGL